MKQSFKLCLLFNYHICTYICRHGISQPTENRNQKVKAVLEDVVGSKKEMMKEKKSKTATKTKQEDG